MSRVFFPPRPLYITKSTLYSVAFPLSFPLSSSFAAPRAFLFSTLREHRMRPFQPATLANISVRSRCLDRLPQDQKEKSRWTIT